MNLVVKSESLLQMSERNSSVIYGESNEKDQIYRIREKQAPEIEQDILSPQNSISYVA